MNGKSTPQLYLAGFDVFRPDAIEHGRYLKALCIRFRRQACEEAISFNIVCA